mmetsp:Transcript_127131/g.368050  ORF Transcript_127131/g.368050 Transcript_127131/m.368050 type:complete len:236 (+) Transcript_127131:715-1422(+)
MSLPVSYLLSVRTSLPSLIAEEKSSRASSLVRISNALRMPEISSLRRSLRTVHSSCFASQAFVVSSKNLMFASFCATVSSYICCVSARRTSDSALTPSFFCLSASMSLSSTVFTAMYDSNFVLAAASSRVAPSKSDVNVSYMSVRMPCTVKDCGEYAAFEPPRKNSPSSEARSLLSSAFAGRAAIAERIAEAAICTSATSSPFEPLGFGDVACTNTSIARCRAARACFVSAVSAT